MTKNRAQLAQDIFQLQPSDDDADNARKIAAIIGDLPFPEAKAVFDLVTRMLADEVERAQRKYEQVKLECTVFDGLPDNLTLGEAARIKAEAGDPFGKIVHEKFSSREWRVGMALIRAACAVHPGWIAHPNHTYTKLDPKAPEENALIEWFQINHPKQARAIERAVT